MIATTFVLLGTLAVIYGGLGSSSSNNSNTNRTDGSSISAALLLGHNQAAPVAKYGGDCRNTPTYCDRARVSENVVHCYCKGPWFGDEDAPPKSFNAHLCRDKRCSEQVYLDFPDWCSSDYMRRFGGCSGGCSGTYDCLNLNFHCAEGEYCEMECTGKNSCVGLTMYCADNQFCELKCNGRGSCVNAKVKCGKGTVAQSDQYNHGCVLADTADDCDKPIGKVYLYSLYKYEIMASFYSVLSSCDYYSLTLCVFNNHNLNISLNFSIEFLLLHYSLCQEI